MKNIFLLIIITCLVSCGGSAVTNKLADADSLVIVFNKPNSDSVIKTVNTTEEKAIKKLSGFVDGKKGEEFKCGYDGNMTFYSKGQIVLQPVFKYSEAGCRHFLFELDGKVMSTKMSNEAADFLKSLMEGKDWY